MTPERYKCLSKTASTEEIVGIPDNPRVGYFVVILFLKRLLSPPSPPKKNRIQTGAKQQTKRKTSGCYDGHVDERRIRHYAYEGSVRTRNTKYSFRKKYTRREIACRFAAVRSEISPTDDEKFKIYNNMYVYINASQNTPITLPPYGSRFVIYS